MATRLLRKDEIKLVLTKLEQIEAHLKDKHAVLLERVIEYFDEAFKQNEEKTLTENQHEEWVNGFSLRHGAYSVMGTIGELLTLISSEQRKDPLTFVFEKDLQIKGIDFVDKENKTYSVKLAEIRPTVADGSPLRSIFLDPRVAERICEEHVDFFSFVDIRTNYQIIAPAINVMRGVAKASRNPKQRQNGKLIVFYDQMDLDPSKCRYQMEV